MRVVVTGAGGFIGSRLVRSLVERGRLTGPGGRDAPITELVLVDVAGMEPETVNPDIAVTRFQGDISDGSLRREVFAAGVDSVFHLAAVLTAEAQNDPSKGTRVNVRGLLDILEECRSTEAAPRFVYPSSIACYGGRLPELVDDDVVQQPQTSYGCHKVIAEQLINDYTRHGIVDGRALRLPIVLTRPPSAAPSVSDQVAGIIREPLAGRDFTCPFRADTMLTVASVDRVARALIGIHEMAGGMFDATRAINLPALSVTPAEMVAAIEAVAGDRPLGAVRYEPEPAAQAVVDGWPKHFVSRVASRAGLAADAAFEAIVESYLGDQ